MIETAILEKLLKNRLAIAAEHFNRDYKKGFLYLQARPESCSHGCKNPASQEFCVAQLSPSCVFMQAFQPLAFSLELAIILGV